MPPEGTPSQGTWEDQIWSISYHQHHSHCLFQTHTPWDLVQWWLCPLCQLGVPIPHSVAPRKAKPGNTQSLKTHWDQQLEPMSLQFRRHQARGHPYVPIPGTHPWE